MISKKNLIDKEFELLKHVKFKYKLNIEKACFATGWIPKYIILDRTRNIHSYCVFIFEDEFSFTTNFINSNLEEYYKIRYSALDRPLFIFLISENFNIKFFEINDYKNLVNNQILNKENLNKLWVNFDSMSSLIKSEL